MQMFLWDESGVTAIEYALVCGLISVACLVRSLPSEINLHRHPGGSSSRFLNLKGRPRSGLLVLVH
jgi:Flp/Fap pilin component